MANSLQRTTAVQSSTFAKRANNTFNFLVLLALVVMGGKSWGQVNVNGTIGSSEYGTHVNGSNQQSSTTGTWYMTWDATNLYVGISGTNTAEGAVLYLDKNPLVLVNGGTNANGNLTGFNNYDGSSFANLQFRADLVVYFKDSYREYRTADGAGGWSAPTASFGSYASASGTREVAIPWSAIGGMPAAFNWFGYVAYSGGGAYASVPTENPGSGGGLIIGASARWDRYYTVSSTTIGSSTLPFSRNSYCFTSASDVTSFGSISCYDFTMNSSGRFVSRTGATAGNWSIGGNLVVGNGTVYLGSGGTNGSYGATNVTGSLNLLGGTFDMDQTTGAASITGNVSIASGATLKLSGNSFGGGDIKLAGNWSNSGTFTPNSRTVTFNSAIANQTLTGTNTFNNLTANNTAFLGNVTASGSLTVNGLMRVQAGTFTSATQYNDVQIDNGATLTLSGDIDVSGNWSNSGTLNSGAGFAVKFNKASGTQTVDNGSSSFYTLHHTGAGTLQLVNNNVTTSFGFYNYAGTLDLNTKTMNLFSSWWNDGTASIGNGTVNFTSDANIEGSTVTQFNNVSCANAINLDALQDFKVSGNWSNNGTLVYHTSTATFNGISIQSIGGFGNNSFYNLILNNAAGANITGADVLIYGTMTLTSGNLNIGTQSLNFYPASSVTGNPGFSASNMIIADGGGLVAKFGNNSTEATFTFPVGDNTGTVEYSPITLQYNFGIFSGGYSYVRLSNTHNTNDNSTTNYLNRYWTVDQSGYSSFTCNVSAYYVDADIVGTEANIVTGKWNVALPWLKNAVADAPNNKLYASNVGSFSVFTGISNPVITINEGPTASVCLNGSLTLNTTASGAPALSYQWSGGLGTASTASPSTASVGSTVYTVTVTDGNGITSTTSINVTVVAPPTLTTVTIASDNANTARAKVGNVVTVNFTSSVSLSTPTVTIAGNVASVTGGPTSWSASYTMQAADAEGIVAFNISFSSTFGCAGTAVTSTTNGSSVTFDKTAPILTAVNIASDNASPSTAIACNIVTLTFTSSETIGTPTVSIAGHAVAATNTSGNNWTASYTMIPADASGIVTFNIAFSDLSGNSNSRTTTTDGSSVTFNNITSPVDAGTPFTKTCVSNPAGATIGEAPQAGCTYSWSPATGLSSTSVSNPTANPTVTTDYTVTKTKTANSCVSTASVIVTVNTTPPTVLIANNTNPVILCPGQSTVFTLDVTSNANSYAWAPAATLTPTTGASVTATPTATTFYTVTGTNSTNGCTASSAIEVILHPAVSAPVITPANPSICPGTGISLSVTGAFSDADYYTWDPAVTNTTSGSPVTASPSATTTYTITAHSSFGCTATGTVEVIVKAATTVSAGSSFTITCVSNVGGALIGEANDAGATYSWSPSSGLSSTSISNPNANPLGTTTYTVTKTNTTTLCEASATVTVTVNANPPATCSVTPFTKTCVLNPVGATIGETSDGSTYSWAPATNLSSTSISNPLANPSVTTIYTVTKTGANGCSSGQIVTVTVDITNPSPTATTDFAIVTCTDPTATLTAFPATGVTYAWSHGLGTGQSASATPTVATTYTVTVTNNSNGCTAIATVFVDVNKTPPAATASANFPTVTCTDPTALLTSGPAGPNYTYLWSTGLFTSNPSILSVTPSITTAYVVTVTDISNGCAASATVTVTVDKGAPAASASADLPTVNCTNPTATLTALPATGVTYAWSHSLGTSQTASVSPTSGTTTYTVTVTNIGNGCAANATVDVTADKTPPAASASANFPTVNCTNPTATLTALPAIGVTYLWSGGLGSSQTASVTPTSGTTTYSVTLANIGNGCSAIATVDVTADKTPPTVTASASPATICDGSSSTLTADGAITYSWMPGSLTGTTVSVSPTATTTYTVTGTAANGCVSTGTVTVTVNRAPAFSLCPGNQAANTLSNSCDNTVTYTATATGAPTPALTYAFTGATTGSGSGTGSGSSFNKGTTTVTITATNLCGSAICTFDVVITDATAPTIACAANVTINNTPGLCTGTTTLTAPSVSDNCVLGNALNFDGSNDFISVPYTTLNSGLTYGAWIKTTSTAIGGTPYEGNPGNAIIGDHTNGIFKSFGISSGKLSYYTYTTSWQSVIGVTTINDNNWHYVVVTHNSSSGDIKLYVDGVVDASSTINYFGFGGGSPAFDRVGGSYLDATGTGALFDGTMDEVSVFSGSRTLAQIQSAQNGLAGNEPGLLLYYNMNQGIPYGNNAGVTTATDASGNSLNGTLNNFTLNGSASNWVGGNVVQLPTLTNNAPPTYPIGNTTVTWTATDASGNVATCNQTVTVVAPEINLVGITNNIADGANSPNVSDFTQFGTVNAGSTLVRTFTIQNTGTANLTLASGSITLAGADASLFTIGGITLPATIAGNSSTTFTVTFAPLSVGVKNAVVHVANNDCDEADYDFAIQGTGGCIAPSLSTSQINISCVPNNPAGSATVTATAGTPPYTYLWNDGAAQTTATATGLAAGTYTVTVTAAGGCATSTSVTITGSTDVPTLTTTTINSACGAASVNLNSGITSSTVGLTVAFYANSNLTGSISSTATTSGTYYVKVTDNVTGCTASGSIVVNMLARPLLTTAGIVTPCGATTADLNDGITSSTSGLTVAFYADAQLAVSIGNTVNASGNYYVMVTGSNGCTSADVIVVNIRVSPTVSISGNTTVGSVLTANASPTGTTQYIWMLGGTPVSTVTGTWGIAANFTFGGTSAGASGFSQPEAIAIDAADNLYIADRFNNRIQKWATPYATGVTVAGGNGSGSTSNKLTNPTGVALDAAGNVYVADYGNHRIQKWLPGATSGTTVAGGNGAGNASNQLNNPADVFVGDGGNLYVAEYANNRVTKWAPNAANGVVVAGGNGAGSAANQLSGPYGVTVDGAGNVYVVDQNNSRVVKWSSPFTTGVTVAGGNGAGSALNQLDAPAKVRVDCSGNVFVTDHNNSRVVMWTPGATAGVEIENSSVLDGPLGLAFDSGNNLWVSTDGDNFVNRFAYTAPVNTYTANVAGDYTVIATGANCCTATSAIHTINAVNAGGPYGPTCSNASPISLNGTPSGGTWSGTGISGNTFNPLGLATGNYTLTYTYNAATAQTVVYVDNAAPVVSNCPSNINANTGSGATSCSTIVTWTEPTSTDNCGTALSFFSRSNAPGSSFIVGITTVTYVFNDAAGNTTSCSFTVTVADNTVPQITCGGTLTVNNSPLNCSAFVTVTTPLTSDNCAVSTVLNNRTGTNDASDTYPVGTTVIIWTVTDNHGNINTCNQSITVVDNEVPVITCSGNLNLVANSIGGGCNAINVSLIAPVVSDNCGGTLTATNNHPSTTYPVGTTSVVWTVTDTHNNTNTCTQTVTVSSPLIVASGAVNNVSCKGNSTGSINLTVSGGLGILQYLWNGGVTSQNRTGLYAGSYTVTISDNCTSKILNFTVYEPSAGILLTSTFTKPKCTGSATGTATVTVSGGTGIYSFLWSNGKTTASVTGLAAGTYTVSVSDVNCYRIGTIIITNPVALSVNTTLVTNPTFASPNGGVITVAASGGTPNYLYLWNTSPLKTTATITGLAAGTYTVKATDKNSCTATKSVQLVLSAKQMTAPQTDSKLTLDVMPNPGDGVFNVKVISNSEGKASLTLMDAIGQIMMEDNMQLIAGNNAIIMDASALPKGIYLLRFTFNETVKTIRVIIQ